MNPGRELDALVAEKVFGETIFKHKADWEPPEYSTDISAAWEVVNKLSGGFYFSIDGQWRSQLTGKISWRSRFKPSLDAPYISGDTAPHAICLAALKAVGEP